MDEIEIVRRISELVDDEHALEPRMPALLRQTRRSLAYRPSRSPWTNVGISSDSAGLAATRGRIPTAPSYGRRTSSRVTSSDE